MGIMHFKVAALITVCLASLKPFFAFFSMLQGKVLANLYSVPLNDGLVEINLQGRLQQIRILLLCEYNCMYMYWLRKL